MRTAAAGAVAAKHLARVDSCRPRHWYAITPPASSPHARQAYQGSTRLGGNGEKAERLAHELSTEFGFPVIAHHNAEAAVAGAHVIVTTTPASEPILKAEWLQAGQHVTAMGSDAEHKNEIDPAAIVRADIYVADSIAQTCRLGELHHAIATEMVSPTAVYPERGEVIAGLKSGRLAQRILLLS